MKCDCQEPISDHWHVLMTAEELDRWSENTKVCAKTQGELSILELTCDAKGCLNVSDFNDIEDAFKAGWRGVRVIGFAKPIITEYHCPDCAPKLVVR